MRNNNRFRPNAHPQPHNENGKHGKNNENDKNPLTTIQVTSPIRVVAGKVEVILHGDVEDQQPAWMSPTSLEMPMGNEHWLILPPDMDAIWKAATRDWMTSEGLLTKAGLDPNHRDAGAILRCMAAMRILQGSPKGFRLHPLTKSPDFPEPATLDENVTNSTK